MDIAFDNDSFEHNYGKTGLRDHIYIEISEKIRSKKALIGVIGLGYVGLPLAVTFAESGFCTIGFDSDPLKMDLINRGQSYIPDISHRRLLNLVNLKRLRARDFSFLKKVDVAFICVPTPFNKTKDPNLSYIEAAVGQIKKYMHPGMMIVLESTTYPGTTEEFVLPRLELNGMKVGRDFYLVFSPERVDPGNNSYNTSNTPKIIGGTTTTCAELGRLLYSQVITNQAVHLVSSTAAAEMTKLLENTFRAVNIALVNELAQLCNRMGISVWEVINAASTKPFGYMPFYPGPGVGGHCIPVDPYYLAWKAREYDFHTRFIELAIDVNNRMPNYVLERIIAVFNQLKKPLQGARILALGVTFKKNIDDCRHSPAIQVMELLLGCGVDLAYNDPYVPCITLGNGCQWVKQNFNCVRLESVSLDAGVLAEAECVIILVDHDYYNWKSVIAGAQLIFDTRNATRGYSSDKILKL